MPGLKFGDYLKYFKSERFSHLLQTGLSGCVPASPHALPTPLQVVPISLLSDELV